MFATTDWVDIMVFLNITPKDKDKLLQAMTAIEIDCPELIPKIQECLTDLKTNKTNLDAERGSANSALIRADVLEWSEGERSKGMLAQRDELRECLFNLLNLAEFGFVFPGSDRCLPGTGNIDTCITGGW